MDSNRRRRLVSGVLFACSAALLATASLTPFWSYSNVTPTFTDSSDFFVGSQFRDVCTGGGCYSGWTASRQYGQSMGDLYTVAWWLLAGGALVAVLATVSAVLGLLGRPTSLLTSVLAIVGVGLAIFGPLTVLAFQPHAYTMDVAVPSLQQSYFPCNTAENSPCSSFFGSAQAGAYVWGAGTGWYAALVAAALLLAGGLVSRPQRDDPRIWQARFAVLTVLLGSSIFAVVYSVIWRSFPGGFFAFYFTVGLLAIPVGVCCFLVLWARRNSSRARSDGWTPS
ncbi:MAG: hypothetical protein ACLP74_08440 [Thermoplasmata archaeon]